MLIHTHKNIMPDQVFKKAIHAHTTETQMAFTNTSHGYHSNKKL